MPQENNTKKPITIAVAGGTGSGKTTVARSLVERVGAEYIAHVSHDYYYKDLKHLPENERKKVNFDHPDSLDTALMVEQLKQLQLWQPIEMPTYDFAHDTRAQETIHVEPSPIILVDGILIFAEPELRELFDIKIFVDTDADIRFIRRLQRDIVERGRDVQAVINRYLNTVRPMHMEFVEPSRRYADVIVPEGGYNNVAIDMIADRVRMMLAKG